MNLYKCESQCLRIDVRTMSKWKKVCLSAAFLICAAGVSVVGFYKGYQRGCDEGRMDNMKLNLPVRLYTFLQMYKMRKMLEQPEANGQEQVPSTADVREMATRYYNRRYLPYKEDYEKGRWTDEGQRRFLARSLERVSNTMEMVREK